MKSVFAALVVATTMVNMACGPQATGSSGICNIEGCAFDYRPGYWGCLSCNDAVMLGGTCTYQYHVGDVSFDQSCRRAVR